MSIPNRQEFSTSRNNSTPPVSITNKNEKIFSLEMMMLYFRNGSQVGTSLLYLGEGVAGIYNVATLPEVRHQGIGSALTVAPLVQAHEWGYRIGTLQSTPMGLNLYHRLGFRAD